MTANLKRLPENLAAELLLDGSPLVGEFVEAVPGEVPAAVVSLLVNSFSTKAGTKVTVAQAMPTSDLGRRALETAMKGDDRQPPLRAGDMVCFGRAYARGGVAWVDGVTARTHDWMEGPVQVLTAMARPSLSKVSKKGASQSLVVSDGLAAALARSAEDVRALWEAVAAREWPGGTPGFVARDRDGRTREFYGDDRQGVAFVLDDMKHEGYLDGPGGPLELVPVWRLPMGREQVVRDVNPRKETPQPVAGDFTKQFLQGKYRKPGFRQCLVIAADEEEWAFGGKTGRKIRVAAGVQPLYPGEAVASSRLPSSVRKFGGAVDTVLTLHDAAALVRLAGERASARGTPAPQPAVSATAARTPPPVARPSAPPARAVPGRMAR